MTRPYIAKVPCCRTVRSTGEPCQAGAVEGTDPPLCSAHLKRTPGSKEKAAARHARAAAEAIGVDAERYSQRTINIVEFLAEIATDARAMLAENQKHARLKDGALTDAGWTWDVLVKAATRIIDTVNRSALADEIIRRTQAEEHEATADSAKRRLRDHLATIARPALPEAPRALPAAPIDRQRRPLPLEFRELVGVLAETERRHPEHGAFLAEVEAVFERWWTDPTAADSYAGQLAEVL